MTNHPEKRPVSDLKDLMAWQVAMDFAVGIYQATRGFPEDERFGLCFQLRRAGISVPSNIAEGHGRVNRKDYARFVLIARGSLKEAETQLLIARRLRYMTNGTIEALLDVASRINRLLWGLHKRLRERAQAQP